MSPRVDVLTDDARQIAEFLRANPEQWYLISPVPCGLERRSVIKQTGHRIRTGKLLAFPLDERGHWEVRTTAALGREDAVAEVEMTARWVPRVRSPGAGDGRPVSTG